MRGRRRRFNIGKLLSMGRPGTITSGVSAKAVVGVVPLIAGVLANNIMTGAIAKAGIPYTQKGLGNYVLGLIDAGLLGWGGSYVSKDFGRSVRIGGMVEVLGRALHDIMSHGVGALKPTNMGDFGDMGVPGYWAQSPFYGTVPPSRLTDPFSTSGFQGMADFADPRQIAGAIPTQGQYMNYAMPNANAVAAPMPGQAGQGYRPGMPGMSSVDYAQEATIAEEVGRQASMGM